MPPSSTFRVPQTSDVPGGIANPAAASGSGKHQAEDLGISTYRTGGPGLGGDDVLFGGDGTVTAIDGGR